jgi:hypothetical protein
MLGGADETTKTKQNKKKKNTSNKIIDIPALNGTGHFLNTAHKRYCVGQFGSYLKYTPSPSSSDFLFNIQVK